MQLHQLQRTTKHKRGKRVGRGGKRGKTSGRGTKGQKARAGHRIRPDVREQVKKLPKLRGRGKSALTSIQDRPAVINVSLLEKFFSPGETITPALLLERGIVRGRRGTRPQVKILADGELTKKLIVSSCAVSAAARTKIEAVGGTVA